MKKNYKPSPLDTSEVTLSSDLKELQEQLAKNVHEVWAAGRVAEGWTYGPQRNDELKHHPGLVAYEDLKDSEREYDRATAMETLKLISLLGYEIVKKQQ